MQARQQEEFFKARERQQQQQLKQQQQQQQQHMVKGKVRNLVSLSSHEKQQQTLHHPQPSDATAALDSTLPPRKKLPPALASTLPQPLPLEIDSWKKRRMRRSDSDNSPTSSSFPPAAAAALISSSHSKSTTSLPLVSTSKSSSAPSTAPSSPAPQLSATNHRAAALSARAKITSREKVKSSSSFSSTEQWLQFASRGGDDCLKKMQSAAHDIISQLKVGSVFWACFWLLTFVSVLRHQLCCE
jgi:hypothetical protein